jgi:transcriptional regulator of arginine metabolism
MDAGRAAVTDVRTRRRKAIAEIIRAGPAASQEEVTAKLADLGFNVTQATVSRDLDQIGAVKVKRGGVLSYALPDQIGQNDWTTTRLERIIGEWVHSVEAAGNMLVMKTPPGSAHLVGAAVDQAKVPEIAGTVCGDDTIFLVARDGANSKELAQRFRTMAGAAEPSGH